MGQGLMARTTQFAVRVLFPSTLLRGEEIFARPYGVFPKSSRIFNKSTDFGQAQTLLHEVMTGCEGGIMSTVRPYMDQTQLTSILGGSIMTDENQHEIRCGMCARELYVDEDAYHYYSEALLSGLDNPFRCEVCNEEYES
jgi:hypothetical protein